MDRVPAQKRRDAAMAGDDGIEAGVEVENERRRREGDGDAYLFGAVEDESWEERDQEEGGVG